MSKTETLNVLETNLTWLVRERSNVRIRLLEVEEYIIAVKRKMAELEREEGEDDE